jgi:hypothetical protein
MSSRIMIVSDYDWRRREKGKAVRKGDFMPFEWMEVLRNRDSYISDPNMEIFRICYIHSDAPTYSQQMNLPGDKREGDSPSEHRIV